MLSAGTYGVEYNLQKTPTYLKASLETVASKRVAIDELATPLQSSQVYYLIGNLDRVRSTVNTDAGTQETSFQGEIGFQVVREKDGQPPCRYGAWQS